MSRPQEVETETESPGNEAEERTDAPEPVAPAIDEDVAGPVNAAVHDADE
jgi:hypothetical protein